ncbi:hypothetical protein DID75_05290, partial [Candidatus Marinamargulisbacteria bacterium SCGC AG-410-N11]
TTDTTTSTGGGSGGTGDIGQTVEDLTKLILKGAGGLGSIGSEFIDTLTDDVLKSLLIGAGVVGAGVIGLGLIREGLKLAVSTFEEDKKDKKTTGNKPTESKKSTRSLKLYIAAVLATIKAENEDSGIDQTQTLSMAGAAKALQAKGRFQAKSDSKTEQSNKDLLRRVLNSVKAFEEAKGAEQRAKRNWEKAKDVLKQIGVVGTMASTVTEAKEAKAAEQRALENWQKAQKVLKQVRVVENMASTVTEAQEAEQAETRWRTAKTKISAAQELEKGGEKYKQVHDQMKTLVSSKKELQLLKIKNATTFKALNAIQLDSEMNKLFLNLQKVLSPEDFKKLKSEYNKTILKAKNKRRKELRAEMRKRSMKARQEQRKIKRTQIKWNETQTTITFNNKSKEDKTPMLILKGILNPKNDKNDNNQIKFKDLMTSDKRFNVMGFSSERTEKQRQIDVFGEYRRSSSDQKMNQHHENVFTLLCDIIHNPGDDESIEMQKIIYRMSKDETLQNELCDMLESKTEEDEKIDVFFEFLKNKVQAESDIKIDGSGTIVESKINTQSDQSVLSKRMTAEEKKDKISIIMGQDNFDKELEEIASFNELRRFLSNQATVNDDIRAKCLELMRSHEGDLKSDSDFMELLCENKELVQVATVYTNNKSKFQQATDDSLIATYQKTKNSQGKNRIILDAVEMSGFPKNPSTVGGLETAIMAFAKQYPDLCGLNKKGEIKTKYDLAKVMIILKKGGVNFPEGQSFSNGLNQLYGKKFDNSEPFTLNVNKEKVKLKDKKYLDMLNTTKKVTAEVIEEFPVKSTFQPLSSIDNEPINENTDFKRTEVTEFGTKFKDNQTDFEHKFGLGEDILKLDDLVKLTGSELMEKIGPIFGNSSNDALKFIFKHQILTIQRDNPEKAKFLESTASFQDVLDATNSLDVKEQAEVIGNIFQIMKDDGKAYTSKQIACIGEALIAAKKGKPVKWNLFAGEGKSMLAKDFAKICPKSFSIMENGNPRPQFLLAPFSDKDETWESPIKGGNFSEVSPANLLTKSNISMTAEEFNDWVDYWEAEGSRDDIKHLKLLLTEASFFLDEDDDAHYKKENMDLKNTKQRLSKFGTSRIVSMSATKNEGLIRSSLDTKITRMEHVFEQIGESNLSEAEKEFKTNLETIRQELGKDDTNYETVADDLRNLMEADKVIKSLEEKATNTAVGKKEKSKGKTMEGHLTHLLSQALSSASDLCVGEASNLVNARVLAETLNSEGIKAMDVFDGIANDLEPNQSALLCCPDAVIGQDQRNKMMASVTESSNTVILMRHEDGEHKGKKMMCVFENGEPVWKEYDKTSDLLKGKKVVCVYTNDSVGGDFDQFSENMSSKMAIVYEKSIPGENSVYQNLKRCRLKANTDEYNQVANNTMIYTPKPEDGTTMTTDDFKVAAKAQQVKDNLLEDIMIAEQKMKRQIKKSKMRNVKFKESDFIENGKLKGDRSITYTDNGNLVFSTVFDKNNRENIAYKGPKTSANEPLFVMKGLGLHFNIGYILDDETLTLDEKKQKLNEAVQVLITYGGPPTLIETLEGAMKNVDSVIDEGVNELDQNATDENANMARYFKEEITKKKQRLADLDNIGN